MAGAMSNTGATDKACDFYNKLQQNKKGKSKEKNKPMWIIFKIDTVKASDIVVEHWGGQDDYKSDDDVYDAMWKALEKKEPRYIVLDYNGKVVFIAWNPDDAKSMLKMKYSTAVNTIKNQFSGISAAIQATEAGEMGVAVLNSKTGKT